MPETAGARHRRAGRKAQASPGTLLLRGSFQPIMADAPTVPPPKPDSLNSSLRRNIEALRRRRADEQSRANFEQRLASTITRFTGSMSFVFVHVLVYGFWIIANLGWIPGLGAWDPTFVILAMVASVEAIFLSTFILITQNRMAAAVDRRAELDLQVSLLAEAEITKLVELVSMITERMNLSNSGQHEIEEMKQRVAPEAVLDAIEETEADSP
jgi:uncharacterized membrane protein